MAAAETSIRVLDKEMDKVLEYALILNLRELESHWAGKTMLSENMDHLAFAIRATGNTSALKPLLTAFDEGTIPATSRTAVFSLIARHGDAAQAGTLLRVAAGPNLSVDDRVSLLNAIASADRDSSKWRPIIGFGYDQKRGWSHCPCSYETSRKPSFRCYQYAGWHRRKSTHALSQDAIRAIGGIGGKPGLFDKDDEFSRRKPAYIGRISLCGGSKTILAFFANYLKEVILDRCLMLFTATSMDQPISITH